MPKNAYCTNCKALNSIIYALNLNDFRRICHLEPAKEAWELVELTHEGTSTVKLSKLQMYTSKFKSLRMEVMNNSLNSTLNFMTL